MTKKIYHLNATKSENVSIISNTERGKGQTSVISEGMDKGYIPVEAYGTIGEVN